MYARLSDRASTQAAGLGGAPAQGCTQCDTAGIASIKKHDASPPPFFVPQPRSTQPRAKSAPTAGTAWTACTRFAMRTRRVSVWILLVCGDRRNVKREAHDSQAHPSAQPPDTRRPPILLKSASVGACLTVTWLVGGTDAPPRGVELAVSDFVAPGAASGEPATYKSLDTLEAVLRAGLHGHRDDDEGAGASASASGGAPAPQRAPAPPPPGGPYPHPGDADRFPPGLGPGLPGIAHPFPFPPGVGVGGGGAMVGPHDPLFGGHPGVARPHAPWGGPPPPGLPPGARWDPIAPPGMPGFSPDDFRPPGPRPPGQGGGPRPPHPDIMPPGPGGPNPGWGGGMFG